MNVFVVRYSHRHGTDVAVARASEDAQNQCWEWMLGSVEELPEQYNGERRTSFDCRDFVAAVTLWDQVMEEAFYIDELEIPESIPFPKDPDPDQPIPYVLTEQGQKAQENQDGNQDGN